MASLLHYLIPMTLVMGTLAFSPYTRMMSRQ